MRNEIQDAGQQTGIKLRPYEHHAKYYETDQMGIIHHSNYVKWMKTVSHIQCPINGTQNPPEISGG